MTATLYSGVNPGLLAERIHTLGSPALIVVPDRPTGETLTVNLRFLLNESRVGFLPAWDIQPGDEERPGQPVQERRLDLLVDLGEGSLDHLVVSVRTLATPVLDPTVLERLNLDVGDVVDPLELARKLRSLGFTRRDLVEDPGDFSLRGDLLDLFPEQTAYPLRISFFDDEIEAIDHFHPSTQIQTDESFHPPLELVQQSEFALSPDRREELKKRLHDRGFHDRAEFLDVHPQPDWIASVFGLWPRSTLAPEQLLPDARLLVHEPGECWEAAEHADERLEACEDPLARSTFRSLTDLLGDLTDGRTLYTYNHYEASPLVPDKTPQSLGEPIHVASDPGGEPNPITDFIDRIRDLASQVETIHVHCGEAGFRDRMRDLLDEHLDSAECHDGSRIHLHEEPWHGSFQRGDTARISLDDFFNRTIQRGRIGPDHGRTEYLESFQELEAGDLIVHEEYGIGRFRGLERVQTHHQTRDCLHLEYADGDRLYLPPDQIAWVQKYIADSGFSPSLSSLSGSRWERIKEGVEEDVSELAEELLELYTGREEHEGLSFPPDNLEQKQFEASFPYRETPDQQEAITAVKRDMQEDQPMDRLICGDSGFGKTEVALRAAFKAVSGDHQVVMLVPTTVLARQHYETFSNRFSIFPYRIEMLSRFQTPTETQTILEDLETGDVDVVIGTHRLLSDDVEFDDMGLLIIDEEQRFGVEQKETLKFYRQNVDVLTLSATPIPRTLYMTLSGIQDISRINTPPEERVPIDVEVGPFDASRASHALDRELSRGGQVFWVYNRVRDIEQRTEYVRSLHPDATVDYAHGQMRKADLRRTMDRFYADEIDVLVTTTIIESGLDCPQVNTMVIEDAHEFGLAQLYQLRGRVGRSHEQAHVLMTYPGDDRLTEEAKSRLDAIKECSELGAGFNLAMRDLEIRGAGNILGNRQHGNIRAVGFPLYCKMLQREIRRLREEFEVPKPFPKLKLPGEHYLPESFVPGEKQRIHQYQELSRCRSPEEVDELRERWESTFGPVPEPAEELLRRHRFKILANRRGWNDFRYDDGRMSLVFDGDPPEDLIEAARRVDAVPSVRSNRLFVRRLSGPRVSEWLREVTGEIQPAEPEPEPVAP